MTTEYADLAYLLNQYNLTGEPSGTLSVPNLNLDEENGHHIVTYTYFTSYADIVAASYYDAGGPEAQKIVDGVDYNANIENAIENILNPTGAYTVLFSDVANVDFQEETSGTGIITFAQMEGDFFSNIETSAFAVPYDGSNPYPTENYGDIWINTDQDTTSGMTFFGYNVWNESGNIETGTRGYKILLEEISHSLGIDIIDENGMARNAELDSHKYTVTSRDVHPDMYYDTQRVIGFPDDAVVVKASGNPFPTGLQLYDIAALQAIYGENTATRNEDMGFDDGDGNTTGTTYGIGKGFADDAGTPFIYTIWDGGGSTDTIDASGYEDGVQIDLREGHFSSIGKNGNPDGSPVVWDSGDYDAGNVAIAYGTEIEGAIGTEHNDSFIVAGNTFNTNIDGNGGKDEIDYSKLDTTGWVNGLYGIVNEQNSGTVYDWFENTYEVTSIENHVGTDKDDTWLLQNTAGRTIYGGAGDNDTLDYSAGGVGNDGLTGYTIAMDDNNDGTVTNAFGVADTFYSVENISGTEWDDSLLLTSTQGRTIDLGSGIDDSVSYSAEQVGIVALTEDFDTSFGTTSFSITGQNGQSDVISGVYNIAGTDSHDVFEVISTTSFNDFSFTGGAGIDVYEVRGQGVDIIENGNTLDFLQITSGGLRFIPVTIDGVDLLQINALRQSSAFQHYLNLDDLRAGEGTEILVWNGNSINLVDALPFMESQPLFEQNGYNIPLDPTNFLDMFKGPTLPERGTVGADTLTGDAQDNVLLAGAGDDILTGGAGDDYLFGGTGNDTYTFAAGDGTDTITEAGGIDTILIEGNITLADLTFTQIGNDLQIDIASGFLIEGQFSGDPAKVVEWVEFADGSVYELPNPIMSTNQPPIAVGEQFTGDEDFAITGNVITNDSDPDGDVLNVEPFTMTTANGASVEMLADGSFTYTPAADFNGTDSFDYTLTDGDLTDMATVDITVNAVNDAPTVQGESYDVNEDGTLSGNVLANDTDIDGDALSVIAEDIVTAGGGSVLLLSNGDFIYSPAANYNGADGFEYTVIDGNGGEVTGSVAIDVLPVNDAPDAVDDTLSATEDVVATGNVLDNDNDIDGDALSVQPQTITTQAGGQVVLEANGDYTYTAAGNYNGADSFEYTLVDVQGATDTASVAIDIAAVNDAPEAFDDSFAGIENSEIEGNLLADNGHGADFDIDGDTLRVQQTITTSAQGGSVIIMANGDFTYMPPAGYSGADSFEYTLLDDNGGSATAMADITLEPLNNPPEARDDNIDGIYDLTIAGNVLEDNGNGADSDPDGDALSVQSEAIFTDNGGIVTLNDDGSFAYTPAEGFYGEDSFDYTVFDGQGASATATATVTIDQPDQIGDNGFDLLFGSRGDDVMAGLDGTDLMFGRKGDDLLSGGDGRDLLYGGRGDDTLIGGEGRDYLFGGKGDDALYGGDGHDRLSAGRGNDMLEGGAGNDYLSGSKGDDVLRGGDGKDTLRGGRGADTFAFDSEDTGIDTIKDFRERDGDTIDISDVLVEDYDPVTDLLSNYVDIDTHRGRNVLKVDADGAGTEHEMEAVAIINNNRNLDAQEMYDQGSLII